MAFKLFRRNKTPQAKIAGAQRPLAASDHYIAPHWHAQVFEAQQRWLKRTLLSLATLTVLCSLSLLLNVLLFPLKEKIPYVLAVNTVTGELAQMGALAPAQFAADWQLARFLIARYVEARESYHYDNIERPYQIAYAMSEGKVASAYEQEASSNNPNSPYRRFGQRQFVTVKILSINKLNDTTASVRFEQTLQGHDPGEAKALQKEAIIRWHYSALPTSQKALDRDPLGFKVTYYQSTLINL